MTDEIPLLEVKDLQKYYTLSPSMKMLPDVGSCNLLIHFIIVVFPQPLGPMRPTNNPDPILYDTPLTA